MGFAYQSIVILILIAQRPVLHRPSIIHRLSFVVTTVKGAQQLLHVVGAGVRLSVGCIPLQTNCVQQPTNNRCGKFHYCLWPIRNIIVNNIRNNRHAVDIVLQYVTELKETMFHVHRRTFAHKKLEKFKILHSPMRTSVDS